MNSKIIGTALLLICGLSVSAQEKNDSNEIENVPPGMGKSVPEEVASDKSKVDVNKIHEIAETMPEPAFNMSRYLSSNLNYPEQAMENRIQGRVVVQFVVERDGNLSAVKVIKGKELGHAKVEASPTVRSICSCLFHHTYRF